MTTKIKRLPVTIQLTPGIDDDLIGWLDQFTQNRERQRTIKAALRAFAGGELPTPSGGLARVAQNTDRLPEIEAMLRYLPQLFDEKLAGVSVANGSTPAPSEPDVTPVPQLTNDEIVRRNERMKRNKNKWS